MFNFHSLEETQEKLESYFAIRDYVRKDHQTAEVEHNELTGYCVMWLGIAISDNFPNAYDAWLDVALPY